MSADAVFAIICLAVGFAAGAICGCVAASVAWKKRFDYQRDLERAIKSREHYRP